MPGAQQSSEPDSSVAAQGEAAAMAEPRQKQGTRVSQKKVDQVKVDPLLDSLHVACALLHVLFCCLYLKSWDRTTAAAPLCLRCKLWILLADFVCAKAA